MEDDDELEYEVIIDGHAEWVTLEELTTSYQIKGDAQKPMQQAMLPKVMYERC